jgi:hypothetical protein
VQQTAINNALAGGQDPPTEACSGPTVRDTRPMPAKRYTIPVGSVPLDKLYEILTVGGDLSRYAARAALTDFIEREPPPDLPTSWRLVLTEEGGIALRTPHGDIPGSKILLRYQPHAAPQSAPGKATAAPTPAKTRRATVWDWPSIRRVDREYCRNYRSNKGRWPQMKERVEAVRDSLKDKAKPPHPKTIAKHLPQHPTRRSAKKTTK